MNLGTYCRNFLVPLSFSPLLTKETLSHPPGLKNIQIEWYDEMREENLLFEWSPFKHLHGNKKPLILVKTNDRGIFYFSISSENLTRWKTHRNLDGPFVTKIKSERESLEQSMLKSFLFSKKLRELDALHIAFEGYITEQERFNAFLNEITSAENIIHTSKKYYKKIYPKNIVLIAQVATASIDTKKPSKPPS